MKIAPHFLGLAMAVTAMPALAKPAYVASTVNLRAAPGTGSEIVAKIPGGSLVDARACTDGWCEITWQDKTGYAIQTALDMSGRVPQRSSARAPVYGNGPTRAPVYQDGPEYAEGPVYYDPPPPVVYYGGPYYRPYYWGLRRHWW